MKLKSIYIKEIHDKDYWNNTLLEFNDANLYQTWDYAKIVQGEKQIKHLTIIQENEVIGLVQIRLRILPIINRGIAYTFNGPLWKKQNKTTAWDSLYFILKVLVQEFSINQNLLLRIKPYIFSDEENIKNFKIPNDFILIQDKLDFKTLSLNLDDNLENIRANFKQRWRKVLNRAERNNLFIVSGDDQKLCKTFVLLYTQMKRRKNFIEHVNPEQVLKMNLYLPEKLRSKIFIAFKDGLPVSGLVGSAMGKNGIALFSATNEIGMKLGASNLLHWERIKWFKEMGCNKYDLGGIDPNQNKGVYEFKLGITENIINRLGTLDSSSNRFSKFIVKVGENISTLR